MICFDPCAADTEEKIKNVVAATLAKHPPLEGLIKPFASVFIEKARLANVLKSDLNLKNYKISFDRLSAGMPLLTEMPFKNLKVALDQSLAALLPALKSSFPAIKNDLFHIESACQNGLIELSSLAEKYLKSGSETVHSTGRAAGLPSDSLIFVINMVLSAVLQSMVSLFAQQAEDTGWNRSYCPVCGYLPSLSFFAKDTGPSSEFTLGGGGQKYLHCAICGYNWRVRRNVCPACENEDNDQLSYLRVEDNADERVDICSKCNHYLPCLDLREKDYNPHLDTASVGMTHLDIMAQEKGFKPMVWTPWNTFGQR